MTDRLSDLIAGMMFCAAMRSSELGILSSENVGMYNWIMWARNSKSRTITLVRAD